MMTKTVDEAVTVRAELVSIAARLRSESSALDAQVLLAHVLGKPRMWLAAHPEVPLTHSELDAAERATERLASGEPLPYVIGHWEFYGLEFDLNRNVLIPRPETELLVEHGIDFLRSNSRCESVVDIGTGCGAIAISIAVHCPNVRVLATDISRAALDVARSNAHKLGVGARVTFAECDILPQPDGRGADLICANLPYVPREKLQTLEVSRHEPALALDGGGDGLDLVRRMISLSRKWLNPGGLILAEIESTHGFQAATAAQAAFPGARVAVLADLSGHDRLLKIAL